MVSRHVARRLSSWLGISSGFRVIDLSVTNQCNLSCEHCSAAFLKENGSSLSLDDYKDIVRQGKELDNLSWNITGGEPLLVDWLDDLIPVLDPARHYIAVQTNCILLSLERARRLARLGVNCITTSLDSADAEKHDSFRNYQGGYQKVLEGIFNAKKAGMQVLVGGIVTHTSLYSSDLIRLIEKVNSIGAIFLFNLAVPCGRWAGNSGIVLTGNDREHLYQLMSIYPMSTTDHEVGRNSIGCPAGMEKIYVSPTGEVLPCPFIQVSFGNCKNESLFTIVDRMRRTPHFNAYQNICLAAEEEYFHKKVFPKLYGEKPWRCPVPYQDIYEMEPPFDVKG